MTAVKRKGPLFDPGLCRCCGSMKKCRVLNVEYESLGEKEVYSDMIMDCFGLLMSHLDGKPTERLICATCVTRIRDALSFRRQVFRCEEVFLQMKMYDVNNEQKTREQVKDSLAECPPKIEIEVKTEPQDEGASDTGSQYGDALADQLDDSKPDTMDNDSLSNEDLPLKHHVTRSSKAKGPEAKTPAKPRSDSAALANQIMITRQRLDRHRSGQAARKAVVRRPELKTKHSSPLAKQLMTSKLPMSKVQQLMRERDPTYMTETNILTIVEFSYACPFKCRHNHLLCYYCGENYSDPKHLREHTETLHDPKKFKVTEHKNMIKLDLTKIDCRLCPIRIDDLEEFKRHVTAVHKKRYYFDYKDSVLPFRLTTEELKCAICLVIFPYFHALNKHMNEHFSNYVCETCGLGFVDKGRFVMHQQRHEEGDFPCDQCGKVFKASYNRDLHIDRVHKKRGRVYCPKCDVKLMSYPQKLKHLVEVHGEAPLIFPCNMCERVCETRRTLTIHRRKDHLKDYRYECQCCGQKFFTRFALNNHMPTHTGERNFKCKVCEKSYPRLKTLKDHMRIHTNDRRYRCHVCGQAFIQNCSLKGHMKSQHPEYG